MTIFEACWQKELANSFTDPIKLLDFLHISTENVADDAAARKLFPLRVPRPFAEKMQKGNVNDPLLKQVMTSAQEFSPALGYSDDPLQEHDGVIPGLLHKYKSRVLMIVKGGCAVNCRYCFRRHFPYQDNPGNLANWRKAADYVAKRPEINEVILSGGDPLMAKDEQLQQLFALFESISHVKRIRIHTRLPVVLPQRISNGLVALLTSSNKKVIVVNHINHPQEIDRLFVQAMDKLQHANITLLNQAVLLKGVNDTVELQVALSEALFAAGILPYYLHLFDRVTGAAHFEVDDNIAQQIYQGMLAELPGFLMPKWTREVPERSSKTPIHYKNI
ncbi:EF-P beta-lysylation protein EpmB [Saccharobesus litoralis]|uniref:L-lysine 2,3-aminomutase n=1 Tax=Saccharobesus litoralis TaxID=2172099 RepID=A0A2S0VNM1_9ALTE|nr:EF-P beta-lysylation protein EpmB [Saccharobesus litoralis]AWB65815.1 EF-P beta-lysylation protein EpmB [Saccharobesus litoralis]